MGEKGTFGSPDTGTSLRETKIELDLSSVKKITEEANSIPFGKRGGGHCTERLGHPSGPSFCWSRHQEKRCRATMAMGDVCLSLGEPVCLSVRLSADYLEANVR